MIQEASIKLLEEMKENDNPAIENIHVYLNQNIDDQLAKGILNKEKTIQEAYAYVFSKAREQAKGSQSAMVPKETVYEWVKEFYLNEDIKVPKVDKYKQKVQAKKPKENIVKKDSTKKNKKENDYEQMSLFSF